MLKIALVPGGAGFIGSHLSELLLSKNYRVIVVDNLTTSNKRNISPFLTKNNFKFIEADICSEELYKILNLQNINEIYHLASPATVAYVVSKPVDTAVANSLGTKKLLDLANKKKAIMLFASSSEVYGNPLQHPQKEDYWGNTNPIGIRSGYDEGKRFGEALCMAYSRQFNMSVKIVRIFNTYGPNSSEKDTRVIPNFIVQALRNKDITVHGNGKQTRSFCYVTDTVKGIFKTMNQNSSYPYNIGNPEEYKIIELAKIIRTLTKSKSKIIYTDRPKDDPSVRKPDITLARNKMNWSPKITLNEGLIITIEYFKTIINNLLDE